MARLFIMVGLPGSGKSTYVNNKLSSCKIVSSDAIREEILGDVNNQEHNARVFQEVYKRVNHYLSIGQDVVLDATSLTRKARKRALRTRAEHVAVISTVGVEECIQRQAHRDRKVPREIIIDMSKRYQEPTIEEGFKAIIKF